jgi:hypothetical protein
MIGSVAAAILTQFSLQGLAIHSCARVFEMPLEPIFFALENSSRSDTLKTFQGTIGSTGPTYSFFV